MLKLLVTFAMTLSVFGLGSHAQAAEAFAPTGVSTQTQSHFNWLTFNCKLDKQDGPATTPQSPPLDVDDPGTPGCNQWEINVIADGDLSFSEKNWELPLLDINYGIGDNLQLKYEVPYVSQTSPDGKASAVGEAKAGIKYMFYQDEEADEQMAVYPQISIVSPDSSAMQKNIASAGRIITLPLLYTKKLGQTAMGDINLTANLGLNLSSKQDTMNYMSAAVGLGIPVHPRFAVMGEISTEQGLESSQAEAQLQLVKVNLGFIGTISKNVLFFASAGHSLSTSDDTSHAYVLSGIQLLSSNAQE